MKRVPAPRRPQTLAPIPRVRGVAYGVLDEFLGYALRRAQVAMFVSFHQATRGSDITPPRFAALVVVGANAGIRQSALGAALGIARSGAMLVTDWLQSRGLVERRRTSGDGRAWGLYLTAPGTHLLETVQRRIRAEERARTAVLRPAERQQLLRLLNKLTG